MPLTRRRLLAALSARPRRRAIAARGFRRLSRPPDPSGGAVRARRQCRRGRPHRRRADFARRSASRWWSTTAAAPAARSARKRSRAPTPDGYTLLVGSNGPLTVNPFIQAKLGYDPLKDFDAVALTSYVPHAIVLNPGVAAKTCPN